MNRKLGFTLASFTLLIMACSPLINDKGVSGSTKLPFATQAIMGKSVNDDLNSIVNKKISLKWDTTKFSTLDFKDINKIKGINDQLRSKYLNKSIYYNPQVDLNTLDSQFVTGSLDEMILYGNFTPDDFGIDKSYFVNNTERVYNSMLKDTAYGIDSGYFFGNTSEQPLEQNNEYIQVKLKVPKGSAIMKVGDTGDSDYILPRDSTLKYTEKTLDKERNTITISAELIEREELEQVASTKQTELNDNLHSLYQTPTDFIKITPLGLNAGYVLNESSDAISKTIESLKNGGVYSKDFFYNEKLELSNGWFINSNLFEQKYSSLSLEERRQEFVKQYSPTTVGETTNQMSPVVNSVITFSHYQTKDTLPQLETDESIAATILHESFHYLTYLTKDFVNIPLYNEKPQGFETDVEALMDEEGDELITLLNDDYAVQNWEEFSSEAFMAKFHPNKEISDQFKEVAPKTNRLIDKLFDVTPPSSPQNIKTTDVEGTSVSLTFDHSSDNVGVNKYNIYMDGQLVKTVDLTKDDNGLSYPTPGDHLNKMEVTIDNLKQITDYEFQIAALDDTENESAKSGVLKVTTKDIEAPQQTGSFSCSALMSTVAQCFWSRPTDNHDVAEVLIYRNESSALGSTHTSSLLQNEQVFSVAGDAISYTDTTIEKGKTYTYYMVAKDAAGNVSDKSNSVTITTSDQDDEKQNEDDAEDVNFSNATLNWGDTFAGLGASAFSIFSWFFDGVNWLAGEVTSVAGDLTSSVVDLSQGVANQFMVVPVDSKGNPLADGLQISVDSVDKSSITTKDSTLYIGQTWNPADNLVSATDENGKEIPYNDSRITSNVAQIDTTKPRVYEVKYSYKGIVKTIDSTFKVTVKEDETSLILRDVNLVVNQEFDPNSPFDIVVDKDGNKLTADNIQYYYIDEKVTKTLDTSKTGTHRVKIGYLNAFKQLVYSEAKTITIKEDKSTIVTKDSILYAGQTWNQADNLVIATDEDGNEIPYSDPRITSNGAQIDTSKVGIYEVKYSYKGLARTIDSTFKVTIKENKASIITKDSTLFVGQTWNPADNLVSATDEEGNVIPYSDSRITSNVAQIDSSQPEVHTIKYSYKGIAKTIDSTFKVTVKYDNLFSDDFSQGLSGWSTDNASIKYYNNKPYVSLEGYSNEVGAIQKNISSTKKGARYRFTIIGSGEAKVAVDSSDYPIEINTGSVNMGSPKTYTYDFTASTDSIEIGVISYGVSSGIFKISIDKLH